MLLATACGCLLVGIAFNDSVNAYEGVFEMIGHAAQSLSGKPAALPPSEQLLNDHPEPNPPTELPVSDAALNPWKPYNQGSLVTAAAYQRLLNLKLPQRRETLDKVIGSPLQTNYASVYGYEDHRTWDNHLLEITYQHGTDQRGQPGWVAVAVEVQ